MCSVLSSPTFLIIITNHVEIHIIGINCSNLRRNNLNKHVAQSSISIYILGQSLQKFLFPLLEMTDPFCKNPLRTAIPESFGNRAVYILEDIAHVMPRGIFCTPLDVWIFAIIILAYSFFYDTSHFADCSIVFYANGKITQFLSFHKVQSLIPDC